MVEGHGMSLHARTDDQTGFKGDPQDIWAVLRSAFRLFAEAFACSMLPPAPFPTLIELRSGGRRVRERHGK